LNIALNKSNLENQLHLLIWRLGGTIHSLF